MEKLNDLKCLLIKDATMLLDSENQQKTALPVIMNAISDPDFRSIVESHIKEIKTRIENLESLFDVLNDALSVIRVSETCEAMRGLIMDAEEIIDLSTGAEVRDAGLVLCLQQMKHYQIAAYGAVCSYARMLQYEDIADKLRQNLEEEKKIDRQLGQVAIDTLNYKAITAMVAES